VALCLAASQASQECRRPRSRQALSRREQARHCYCGFRMYKLTYMCP